MILLIQLNVSIFGCVLPDDADIVLGFVKVAGGSGLLSMIVPTAQRPFIFLFTIAVSLIQCSVAIIDREG